MKNLLMTSGVAALALGCASLASAASMTMTGDISDSMCGASHAAMTSSHKGLTDPDCTRTCVKNGAKYVFVSDGKVYNISNQKLATLSKYAGEKVSLTGDVDGDNITVTKVAMKK